MRRAVARVLALAGLLLLAGCATTGGPDPLAPMNRRFYAFNSATDRLIMSPVARMYKTVTPKPLRASLTNFFHNVAYPDVIVNDFLQGRLGQGVDDIGRFVVNSTIGLFGLFDVATPLGLKAHVEDAGLTLGRWGVGRGPYLVLPFVGPDTLRNTPSLVMGIFTNVLYYVGAPALTVPLTVFDVINARANASASLRYVRENAVDKYVFTRDAYLQHRNYLQDGGHLPLKAVEQMMMPPGPAPAPADPPPLADPAPRSRVVMTVPGRPDVAIRPPVPAG
ncbi:VacJ family lipoprotein [Acidiferrobacter sp. SPIII_3]|uniref:MlaA family lipoprotein n=1 Tax=Acidiferrobacter sp. SPIII_3 TaxID=1281578 RepID=UPI00143D5F8F|nr:VacJ family lipoprotein [Acidiferrobacter sp. SPIII_3]